MSRGKIIAAVVVLALLGAVVGGIVVSAQNAIPQVSTAKAERETLGPVVTASGKVEAAKKADVYPPTAGTLAAVEVTDGQKVKAGQELADMDTDQLEVQVAQAKAALAAAKSQLDQVNRGVPGAIDKSAAQASVTAARAAYNAASEAYSQLFSLVHGIPSQEATLSQALAAKDQAFAALENARAGAAKVSGASRVSAARAAARAGVDQAETSLRVAQDILDDATMVAPIDGVVIFNPIGTPAADGSTPKATAGAAVAPQAAPFTVVQLSALDFNAQVDEADIERVRVGMTAKVSLDALPGESIEAKVISVKPAAIQTTTGGIAFPVLLSLTVPPEKVVLIGMSGSVDIQVETVKDAVTIPIEGLFDENGKKFVFVIEDGKVSKREVTTGVMTDTRAQIVSGLEAGATIATSNLSALKDGSPVRVK